MTAYTKLAALFAGAFLLLAQSTDPAQAGHRQTDREAKKARIAENYRQHRVAHDDRLRYRNHDRQRYRNHDRQRYRNHDRQRYGDQAYWNGRSYGKRGRQYYQQHGDFRRHKAYGQRARQHYHNGDGEYWTRRDSHRNAHRRYGDGDYRQHRRRDGRQTGNFFFDGGHDRRLDGDDRVRRHRHSDGEEHVHRRRNSDDDD
jgi:hypothetical protein